MSIFHGWVCRACGFNVLADTKKELNERKKQHKKEGCATVVNMIQDDKSKRFRAIRKRVQLEKEAAK